MYVVCFCVSSGGPWSSCSYVYYIYSVLYSRAGLPIYCAIARWTLKQHAILCSVSSLHTSVLFLRPPLFLLPIWFLFARSTNILNQSKFSQSNFLFQYRWVSFWVKLNNLNSVWAACEVTYEIVILWVWGKLRRGLGMWGMYRIFAGICKLRKHHLQLNF